MGEGRIFVNETLGDINKAENNMVEAVNFLYSTTPLFHTKINYRNFTAQSTDSGLVSNMNILYSRLSIEVHDDDDLSYHNNCSAYRK